MDVDLQTSSNTNQRKQKVQLGREEVCIEIISQNSHQGRGWDVTEHAIVTSCPLGKKISCEDCADEVFARDYRTALQARMNREVLANMHSDQPLLPGNKRDSEVRNQPQTHNAL